MLRVRSFSPWLALVLALAVPRLASAGLEQCFTPECSDGDPCTCDFFEDDVCRHDPRLRFAAAARASGLELDALDGTVIPPTPDSNEESPDQLAEIPAEPLVHVEALGVEEVQENRDGNAESYAFARATTGAVRILDQGGGDVLVSADAIQTMSESVATNRDATTSTEGSVLTNVVVAGTPIGDVSEPLDLSFRLPLLNQRVDVHLLQTIRVGAAAGEPVPDPEFGVVLSGATVNGIRVTVRDFASADDPKVVADVIVASADSRVDRFSPESCDAVGPRVSGDGFVFNLDLDESLLDVDDQTHRTRIGDVVLPSTGGEERATLAHVGPIVDPSGTLVIESSTAFSRTRGTVDREAGTARSSTETAIEDLAALDSGDGAALSADAVAADCTAAAGPSELESTGRTRLVDVELGGRDVCAALGLQDPCAPPPNTELSGDIPGVSLVLNEQVADPGSTGATGVTVNALHLHVLGAGNDLGLPLGADVIVSRAHCDAFAPQAPNGDGGDSVGGGGSTGGDVSEDPLRDLSPEELQGVVDSIFGLGGSSAKDLVPLPLEAESADEEGKGLIGRLLALVGLGRSASGEIEGEASGEGDVSGASGSALGTGSGFAALRPGI